MPHLIPLCFQCKVSLSVEHYEFRQVLIFFEGITGFAIIRTGGLLVLPKKFSSFRTFKDKELERSFLPSAKSIFILKIFVTLCTTLPSPAMKLDAELLPYCNILDQYPLQLLIQESWSWALLENCWFYGGMLIGVPYVNTLGFYCPFTSASIIML